MATNKRKIALRLLGLGALVLATGCGATSATIGDKVAPNEVVLLINQYGDETTRGIENSELFTDGRVAYNPLNSILYSFTKSFVTYTFSDDEGVESTRREAISASVGGTRVSEDLAVTLRVPFADGGDSLRSYVQLYGKEFKEFITNDVYRSLGDCLNEVVSKRGITTPGQYIIERSTTVAADVQACLETKFPFLEVASVSVLGTPTWSDAAIQEQISARQASVERAEKAKQDAIAAEAEAAANLAKAQGEVDVQQARAALFQDPNYAVLRRIDLEETRLEIQRVRAEKWNGVEPVPINVTGANAQVVGGAVQ
jgi:hypothetical protein